ncbi:MAG: hypothetical protein MK008_06415 [Bdellovibrionales bacterium]|nr:hypothetical protein [Bdellovibrionales bacterium]
MRWMLILFVLFMVGCGSHPSPNSSVVELEGIDNEHFRLKWGADYAHLKIKENFELEVLHSTQEIPKPILVIVQSLSWMTNPEYQTGFNMQKHYTKAKAISPDISLFRLTYFTILYSFKLKNIELLKSIEVFISDNVSQFGIRQLTRLKSLMYFYMAILADNWPDQKNYLLSANALESQDRTLKNYSQIFSLSVLKMSVKYFKDELEKHKYYRKLGMDEAMQDRRLSVGEVLGQTIGNTFNLVRYNIPQYKNHHKEIVQNQINKMQHYVESIDLVLKQLKSGKLLSEINIDKIIEQYPLSESFYISQAYNETKIRGVFFNYIIDGRRVSLPTPQSLRLYEIKEYLYPYWNDRIISEGVNMWSIMLLIKGPQIVELVFGLHGAHTHVKIMSLRSLWTQPWEWTKTASKAFGFWIKAETLDGCLPTWAFIIASAFTPDANNDIDNGVPFIDENYNKKRIPLSSRPGTYGL